jgi:hypothetical protein
LVAMFNYNMRAADPYDEGRSRLPFRLEINRYLSKWCTSSS